MFSAEFFPTPTRIVHRMLSKVSLEAKHFLEPSAGKGDIADAIKGRNRHATVDCIEQSPELVSMLIGKDFPVVGFDWLEYSGVCYYDAIIMNPPFSNGDDHLLRAWDFLHHGEIVCLLNEETIKNPHTAARKRLAAIIEAHGQVEFLSDCFSSAQRKTSVNVAMVYLKKTSGDDAIDLWANVSEERAADDNIGADRNMLAIKDSLGNMQHFYDQANEHMVKAFQHLRKASLYMQANGIDTSEDYRRVVGLAFDNINSAKAEYIRAHRLDAWRNVFDKMEFRKWLDKKQTDDFIRDIERNGNIPFTKENIKGTLENVFLQRSILFEKSVANIFDELTRYYKGNTNHTEGWKTNDSYKVNQKIVFPYGCSYEPRWGGRFSLRYGPQLDIYNDLDRVLCVLDGADFEECLTVGKALQYAFDIQAKASYGQLPDPLTSPEQAAMAQKATSTYFDIRFFKKGTVHLTFKDKHLWAKFNVTAAKGKAWIGQQTQHARGP